MTQLALEENAVAAAVGATEGMSQALRAERVQLWKEAAARWLAAQESGIEFVADDLVRAIGLPDFGVAKNNVVGAWIAAQARRGTIIFAGRLRKSQRVIGHGNLQRVWIVA